MMQRISLLRWFNENWAFKPDLGEFLCAEGGGLVQ